MKNKINGMEFDFETIQSGEDGEGYYVILRTGHGIAARSDWDRLKKQLGLQQPQTHFYGLHRPGAGKESKPEKGGECKLIGEARTVGELKAMLNEYPDDTSFGFRNQPMQALYEVRYGDNKYVVFQ